MILTSSDPDLAGAIERFKQASAQVELFTNGDASVDIVGNAGTYPSLAKLTSQVQDKLALLNAVKITNVGNSDMVFGQPVYALAPCQVDLASAAYPNKKTVVGFVVDDLILSQSGNGHMLANGVLVGSVAQWEVATGMAGGLLPNTDYFLDTVAGRLTPFAPQEAGQFLCPLGYALSETLFQIRIERPITL